MTTQHHLLLPDVSHATCLLSMLLVRPCYSPCYTPCTVRPCYFRSTVLYSMLYSMHGLTVLFLFDRAMQALGSYERGHKHVLHSARAQCQTQCQTVPEHLSTVLFSFDRAAQVLGSYERGHKHVLHSARAVDPSQLPRLHTVHGGGRPDVL
jgi:hypothetical protein